MTLNSDTQGGLSIQSLKLALWLCPVGTLPSIGIGCIGCRITGQLASKTSRTSRSVTCRDLTCAIDLADPLEMVAIILDLLIEAMQLFCACHNARHSCANVLDRSKCLLDQTIHHCGGVRNVLVVLALIWVSIEDLAREEACANSLRTTFAGELCVRLLCALGVGLVLVLRAVGLVGLVLELAMCLLDLFAALRNSELDMVLALDMCLLDFIFAPSSSLLDMALAPEAWFHLHWHRAVSNVLADMDQALPACNAQRQRHHGDPRHEPERKLHVQAHPLTKLARRSSHGQWWNLARGSAR